MSKLRPIPGRPKYSISAYGVVWSFKGLKPKRLSLEKHRQGYLRAPLSHKGKLSLVLVHRLVTLTWIGPPPFEGAKVLHKDDDPTNNHYSNLYYGTQSNNMKDAVANGRLTHIFHIYGTSKGEKNGNSKLTNIKVKRIKKMLREGYKMDHLAKQFQVSRSTIEGIKYERVWKHVK